MSVSTHEIQMLINAGGSVSIDASQFASRDLQIFVNSVSEGACLTLRNAQRLSQHDRQILANGGQERVNFVFE